MPSLLTLTSIFFAFYSVVEAIKENFVLAAGLILVAGFFDGIDGKVARLTNTTTRFGVELDSLADVISFGGGAGDLDVQVGPFSLCTNRMGLRIRVRGLWRSEACTIQRPDRHDRS